jgi:hypothetical protein
MVQIELVPPPAMTGSDVFPVNLTLVDGKPETVGQVAAGLEGVDSLHSRVIPGRRAAIDWLIVTRGAVFVVDEYSVGGTRPATIRATQGGAAPWTLTVNGQDQPMALPGAQSRAAVVRDVLADAGVTADGAVVPVVCYDRASLPPMRRQLRLGDCVVVGLPGLGRLLRTPGPLSATDRELALQAVEAAFPASAPRDH